MQCPYSSCSLPLLPYPPFIRISPSPNPNLSASPARLRAAQIHTRFDNRAAADADVDSDNFQVVKSPLPSHVKSITSTSNPFVKHCLKLRQSSSYRHSHRSALVVGTTPIWWVFVPPCFLSALFELGTPWISTNKQWTEMGIYSFCFFLSRVLICFAVGKLWFNW